MPELKSKLAKGVYAASLTPLNDQLEIDHVRLAHHCHWLLEHGCTGILLMGTTGEANSFSIAERMVALDAVIESGIPAQKLLVGTGCCAVPDTILLSQHALSHNVAGLVMLPPFYYKNANDAGLFDAFDQIIHGVNDDRLKIYLYHFPQMSAVPFSFSLIEKLLATFPDQIAGIKDSSGEWENMKLLATTFPNFQVFAGSERFLAGIKEVGGAGCISATVNVSCRDAAFLFQETQKNRIEELQNKLNKLRLIIEKYPMIPTLKQVMYQQNAEPGWLNMRPPHIALTKQEVSMLTNELAAINFPNDYIQRVE